MKGHWYTMSDPQSSSETVKHRWECALALTHLWCLFITHTGLSFGFPSVVSLGCIFLFSPFCSYIVLLDHTRMRSNLSLFSLLQQCSQIKRVNFFHKFFLSSKHTFEWLLILFLYTSASLQCFLISKVVNFLLQRPSRCLSVIATVSIGSQEFIKVGTGENRKII